MQIFLINNQQSRVSEWEREKQLHSSGRRLKRNVILKEKEEESKKSSKWWNAASQRHLIWQNSFDYLLSSLSLPLFFPQYTFFCTLLADGNWRFSHDNYYRAFNDQQLQNERSSYEITNVNNFISMLLAFDVSFFCIHSL